MDDQEIERDLSDKIATSCRIVARECPGRSQAGHVSVRALDGETMLIKARGVEEEGMDFVRQKDIIRVNFDGKSVGAPEGLSAPRESSIHIALYAARPDIGCVIHAHPRVIVALSSARRELLPIYNAYDPSGLSLIDAGVPVFEKSVLINSLELGQEVASFMGDKKVCILHGHGIVAVGRDVEEATAAAVSICEVAEVNRIAYSVGTPTVIPEHERMSREPRGPRPRRADGTTPNWHWLRQRADGAQALL